MLSERTLLDGRDKHVDLNERGGREQDVPDGLDSLPDSLSVGCLELGEPRSTQEDGDVG